MMSRIISFLSPTLVTEQKFSLVIYGFNDRTGVNFPKANSSSSSDNSLNFLRMESPISILTGLVLISFCFSTRSGQEDSSRTSRELSPHSSHSNPKHAKGALLRLKNMDQ